MKIIGAIPARFEASRFPGKLIQPLLGKPVICWVVEAALKAQCLEKVIVATDDQRIADAVDGLDVEVIMTESALPSGTDRINSALATMDYDIAVNIQGDEPLLQPEHIDVLVKPLIDNAKFDFATLACQLSADQLDNKNRVKVIVDQNRRAIYFSRHPIPHSRQIDLSEGGPISLLHIGLYAYRAESLSEFCDSGVCALESAEGLEQLRMLWMGKNIAVSVVNESSTGIDTPEDLVEIERTLSLKRKHGVKDIPES